MRIYFGVAHARLACWRLRLAIADFSSNCNHNTRLFRRAAESPSRTGITRGTRALPAREGAFDRGFQFFDSDRLNEVFGETGLQTLLDVAVHSKPADGDASDGRHRAEISHQLNSCPVGQRNVANDQIKLAPRGSFHGRAKVVGRGHKM